MVVAFTGCFRIVLFSGIGVREPFLYDLTWLHFSGFCFFNINDPILILTTFMLQALAIILVPHRGFLNQSSHSVVFLLTTWLGYWQWPMSL